jgi:hypothetical protein
VKPLTYATLFGLDDEESRVAFDKVVDWAYDNDIQLTYKAVNERNKAEYLVGDVVTLRYFDYESGSPRREFVGLKSILDFVVAP